MAIKLQDIKQGLADGKTLRFVWSNCHVTLNGQAVDGRSYHAFLLQETGYSRAETGSVDQGDLVITWRKAA